MLIHASAASAAASRTAAPPVSVLRKSRRGVWRFRDYAVSPENGSVRPLESPSLLIALLDHTEDHACRGCSRLADSVYSHIVTWYTFFKSVHVLAAAIWVGGGVMIQALAFRITRTGDPARQATFAKD